MPFCIILSVYGLLDNQDNCLRFYSLQDTKVPMRACHRFLIVNVVCSVILMYPLKHGRIGPGHFHRLGSERYHALRYPETPGR